MVQIRSALAQDAFRQHARGFDKSLLVERDESLKRCAGQTALLGANGAIRRVKGHHRRVQDRAFPERIKTASIEVGALAFLVFIAAEHLLLPQACGLIRLYAGAARRAFAVEKSGVIQRAIADDFRAEPQPWTARQQTIERIASEKFRSRLRRLTVGGRHHDLLLHRLDVPGAVDELPRQPVEQVRMGRLLSLCSKLIARFHEAVSEIESPVTIHRHAAQQRMLRIHQPLRQREAVGFLGRRQRGQDVRHFRDDLVALGSIIPAHADVRHARLGHLFHHAERWNLCVQLLRGFARVGQLGVQRLELRIEVVAIIFVELGPLRIGDLRRLGEQRGLNVRRQAGEFIDVGAR